MVPRGKEVLLSKGRKSKAAGAAVDASLAASAGSKKASEVKKAGL